LAEQKLFPSVQKKFLYHCRLMAASTGFPMSVQKEVAEVEGSMRVAVAEEKKPAANWWMTFNFAEGTSFEVKADGDWWQVRRNARARWRAARACPRARRVGASRLRRLPQTVVPG